MTATWTHVVLAGARPEIQLECQVQSLCYGAYILKCHANHVASYPLAIKTRTSRQYKTFGWKITRTHHVNAAALARVGATNPAALFVRCIVSSQAYKKAGILVLLDPGIRVDSDSSARDLCYGEGERTSTRSNS